MLRVFRGVSQNQGRRHSKMANSFLGNGSVEPREIILTKNDKYKICRGHLGLFKYEKRGCKKGRQRSIGTDE